MDVNIDRQILAKLRKILYKECNKCDVGLPVVLLINLLMFLRGRKPENPEETPRNDDRSLLAHIMESLDRVLASNPGAAVILTGDFNQFKHRQLCSSFSLKQIVKRPTRGSNVLDKIFTNVSKFYNVPDVVPLVGFSDHNSILLTPLNHCKNSRTVRFIRDAHPVNRSLIAEILSHINWSPMYHMNSCNDQFQYFLRWSMTSLKNTFL